MSDRRVLLLNSWFMPHAVIPWQAAVKLIYEENASVLVEYNEDLRSPSVTWKMPAVIRLHKQNRSKRHGPKFSRLNVYMRDKFRCQYCGKKHAWADLSYDHVVPKSNGGRTNWTNIVTACRKCNNRKGSATCDDAGMFPLNLPIKPVKLPVAGPVIDVATAPQEWLPYISN